MVRMFSRPVAIAQPLGDMRHTQMSRYMCAVDEERSFRCIHWQETIIHLTSVTCEAVWNKDRKSSRNISERGMITKTEVSALLWSSVQGLLFQLSISS